MIGVVGIDLGTSCCRYAVDAGDSRRVIEKIPSVVVPNGGDAVRPLTHLLRLVAGGADDPTANTAAWRAGVSLADRAEVERDGERWGVGDLLTQILRRVKADAEAKAGFSLPVAYLTVPVAFSHRQQRALLDAGYAAGFEIVRPVPAPATALLTYLWTMLSSRERRVAVCDVGDGYCDVVVAEVAPIPDATVEVKAMAGAAIGGVEIQAALAGEATEAHSPQTLDAIDEAITSVLCWGERRIAVNLPGNGIEPLVVTRDRLDQLAEHHLAGAVETLCRQCLDRSEWDAVDDLVLLGRMTRIPSVQRAAERTFGRRRRIGLRLLEGLSRSAVGACIWGTSVNNQGPYLLLVCSAEAIGIATSDGKMVVAVRAGSPYPSYGKVSLWVSDDGALTASRPRRRNRPATLGAGPITVTIPFCQGDQSMATLNRPIFNATLTVPRVEPGPVEIQVEVYADIDRGIRLRMMSGGGNEELFACRL